MLVLPQLLLLLPLLEPLLQLQRSFAVVAATVVACSVVAATAAATAVAVVATSFVVAVSAALGNESHVSSFCLGLRV